jgi:hypothetical protein
VRQLSKRLDRLEEDIPPSYIPLWCEAMQADSKEALDAVKAKLSTLDEEGAEFVGRYIEAAEATFFAS